MRLRERRELHVDVEQAAMLANRRGLVVEPEDRRVRRLDDLAQLLLVARSADRG